MGRRQGHLAHLRGVAKALQLVRRHDPAASRTSWYHQMADASAFSRGHRVAPGGHPQGIKTLLMTGFTTTCAWDRDAARYMKGYYIVMVSDCTGAPTIRTRSGVVGRPPIYFGHVATSQQLGDMSVHGVTQRW